MRLAIIVNTALLIVLSGAVSPSVAQQTARPVLQNRLEALLGNSNPDRLLEPDEAFRVNATLREPGRLLVELTPAGGYYLYRDKMRFRLRDTSGVTIKSVKLPPGETKLDPTFGKTVVYTQPVLVELALERRGTPQELTLLASYQGCNEKLGVCYPPVEKAVSVALP